MRKNSQLSTWNSKGRKKRRLWTRETFVEAAQRVSSRQSPSPVVCAGAVDAVERTLVSRITAKDDANNSGPPRARSFILWQLTEKPIQPLLLQLFSTDELINLSHPVIVRVYAAAKFDAQNFTRDNKLQMYFVLLGGSHPTYTTN